MSIKRIWRGWTDSENADTYQELLLTRIFPDIESKNISGYQSIELLRRDSDEETEFITIMTFNSIRDVINFQGEDYEKAYVPEAAQRVLKRWDKVSSHYHVVDVRKYL